MTVEACNPFPAVLHLVSITFNIFLENFDSLSEMQRKWVENEYCMPGAMGRKSLDYFLPSR